MFPKAYNNFVRPSSNEIENVINTPALNGDEARKLYLEEVGSLHNSQTKYLSITKNRTKAIDFKHSTCNKSELSNLQLFYSVQNNDVVKLRQALDCCPDKINIVDEFGWSLLMIACQANSIEAVKELLNRGIDTSTRDKAGNSARTLVIKNKNYVLADILLQQSHKTIQNNEHLRVRKETKRSKEQYKCEICDNKLFNDKVGHLSSTIHNINASKGKKIPANYVIPPSNKGYQLMLRVGWDKEGLGPHGSGKKYPLKVVLKNDRTGLGHKKNKVLKVEDASKRISKKSTLQNHDREKQLEINFRREFY